MASKEKTAASLSYEEHEELCRYYDFSQLRDLALDEPDPWERAGFLKSTFFILDGEVKAHYRDTLEWGRFYIDHIASDHDLLDEDRTPRSDILKRMAIIYERCDMTEHAIWICDLAAHYGIYKDGTRSGFDGRRRRLLKSAPNKASHSSPDRAESK